MKIVKQLAIFLENQPGALCRLTQDLLSQNINIEAVSVMDSIDHAVIRLVVDKPIEAMHRLGEVGVLVIDTDMIRLPLSNSPGALNKIATKLLEEKVNLEYAYGSATGPNAYCYLRVVNVQRAMEALKDFAVKDVQ